jgi:transposase-like protein
MPIKTFTLEQIVGKLRQIEVLVSQGKTVRLACKETGVTAQTFYRWRKEYGGLQNGTGAETKGSAKGERTVAACGSRPHGREADPKGHRTGKPLLGTKD